jgi:hypothetical protein
MTKKLVFLYDSTLKPWHGDIEAIQARLSEERVKGVKVEVLDTKDMRDDELDRWRSDALAASMRHHQQVS